jgi:hypothetical protein
LGSCERDVTTQIVSSQLKTNVVSVLFWRIDRRANFQSASCRLCVLEENLYSVGEPELVEWESGSPI